MAELGDDQVADALVKLYAKSPEATVEDAADKLEVPPEQVARVLHEYRVRDGKAVHAGEGRGGGWVTEEESG